MQLYVDYQNGKYIDSTSDNINDYLKSSSVSENSIGYITIEGSNYKDPSGSIVGIYYASPISFDNSQSQSQIDICKSVFTILSKYKESKVDVTKPFVAIEVNNDANQSIFMQLTYDDAMQIVNYGGQMVNSK